MTRALISSEDHRRKVSSLRRALVSEVDVRHTAINRAVVETLRNPVVARAVARGLRLHDFDKA